MTRVSAAGFLWAAAAGAAGPLLPLWLRLRVARGKEFPARLGERRGIAGLPRPEGRLVWLHGASIGETQSLIPLIQALRAARPDLTLLLSSGTTTSAQLLAARLGGPAGAPQRSGLLAASPGVLHQFAPLDRPAWVARFLDHWRPDLAVFVESELWPNLLGELFRREVPVALLNARLSVRSAGRWARVPALARRLLGGFSLVLAQSQADAERLAALGARAPRVIGNLKWAAPALAADPAELARLQGVIGGRPVWAMASTHEGDEILAAQADAIVRQTFPDLLSIIVPRHPERGAAIAAGIAGATRRAAGQDPDGKIWLCDTLGELGLVFRLAPLVVMGKSFLPPGGGQNPLEPARLGAAVLFGPRMQNFADITARMVAVGAAHGLAEAAALAPVLTSLLNDPAALARMRAAAAQVAAEEAGVLDRTMNALASLIPPS